MIKNVQSFLSECTEMMKIDINDKFKQYYNKEDFNICPYNNKRLCKKKN